MKRKDIYTSLEDAVKEIKRRHNDFDLKKKLEKFWGENRPDFLSNSGPRVVLSKSLITPNLELKYFLDVCKDVDLDKCFLEYKHGKFVGKNQEKRHLGKMFFFHGHGKKNGCNIDPLCIVNFNDEEGKKIHEVKTICGKKMVDFHHEILNKRFPEENFSLKDISDWFNRTRELDDYYVYYLSLFIRDHILFENFIFDLREESKFTKEKFLPSFKKVFKIFKLKPLIVPLLPQENEKNNLWFSYDGDVEKLVKNML